MTRVHWPVTATLLRHLSLDGMFMSTLMALHPPYHMSNSLIAINCCLKAFSLSLGTQITVLTAIDATGPYSIDLLLGEVGRIITMVLVHYFS